MICAHCGAEVWWSLARPDDACPECGKPVGQPPELPTQPCFHCSEPIVEGDAWTVQTVIGTDGAQQLPIHSECSLRMVVGSLGHQRKTCSCYRTPGDDQEDGLTLHEAARAAAFEFIGAQR